MVSFSFKQEWEDRRERKHLRWRAVQRFSHRYLLGVREESEEGALLVGVDNWDVPVNTMWSTSGWAGGPPTEPAAEKPIHSNSALLSLCCSVKKELLRSLAAWCYQEPLYFWSENCFHLPLVSFHRKLIFFHSRPAKQFTLDVLPTLKVCNDMPQQLEHVSRVPSSTSSFTLGVFICFGVCGKVGVGRVWAPVPFFLVTAAAAMFLVLPPVFLSIPLFRQGIRRLVIRHQRCRRLLLLLRLFLPS